MSKYEFCTTVIAGGMLLLKIAEQILLPSHSIPNHSARKFTMLRKSVKKFNELIDSLNNYRFNRKGGNQQKREKK